MQEKRILMIDDEANFCRLTKMNLELALTGDFKFKVDIATNGKEGIKSAKRVKPDLILLDIIMPGMDGFGVLGELKKDKDTMSIPVIMLTAKADEASKAKAAQLYNESYIAKPIEASDLKAKIEEVLKRGGS